MVWCCKYVLPVLRKAKQLSLGLGHVLVPMSTLGDTVWVLWVGCFSTKSATYGTQTTPPPPLLCLSNVDNLRSLNTHPYEGLEDAS